MYKKTHTLMLTTFCTIHDTHCITYLQIFEKCQANKESKLTQIPMLHCCQFPIKLKKLSKKVQLFHYFCPFHYICKLPLHVYRIKCIIHTQYNIYIIQYTIAT